MPAFALATCVCRQVYCCAERSSGTVCTILLGAVSMHGARGHQPTNQALVTATVLRLTPLSSPAAVCLT